MQFLMSWISVFFLTVLYHVLRYAIIVIERSMTLHNTEFVQTDSTANNRSLNSLEMGVEDSLLLASGSRHGNNIQWGFRMRVTHCIVAGVTYSLALFLMLVAMTYNSTLFLALVFGYGFGDFLFFNRSFSLSNAGPQSHSTGTNGAAVGGGGTVSGSQWSGPKYTSNDCH
jgi:hypothetical protein